MIKAGLLTRIGFVFAAKIVLVHEHDYRRQSQQERLRVSRALSCAKAERNSLPSQLIAPQKHSALATSKSSLKGA